jgi:hypothetical protein
MKIPQFLMLASALAVAMIFFGYILVQLFSLPYSSTAVSLAIIVSLIPTLLAYILTYRGLDKDTMHFVGFLATGMIGKMLIGILSIVLVALQFEAVRNEYVVTYILAYFAFTTFEVYGLFRKLRPKI